MYVYARFIADRSQAKSVRITRENSTQKPVERVKSYSAVILIIFPSLVYDIRTRT